MIQVLDLCFDISAAVASAAATGSIVALLFGLIAVAHKHIGRHWGASLAAHAARILPRCAQLHHDARPHTSHHPIQPVL
jgi:hypothetical protein